MSVTAAPRQIAASAPRRRLPDLLPYGFVAPITLLLVAISLYPTFFAIYIAMTDATLLRLARAEFIGAGNVVRMLNDPIFIGSLWRTLRWDVAVVGLQVLIALPTALFLNLKFPGRGLVRAAVLVPYIVPPAVTSLLWVYMFDANFGIANDILLKLGVLQSYYAWMGDPNGSFAIVVAAMVWSGQPLMAIVLLSVLQTIPSDMYEAAQVDGAGAWRRFWHITLPYLTATIFFLVLLRTIWMSHHVDVIFIMTRGGPGFANYTAAVYSFLVTNQFEIGYSSALALGLAVLLLAGSVVYVRHIARSVLR